jgi:hypothetical protein
MLKQLGVYCGTPLVRSTNLEFALNKQVLRNQSHDGSQHLIVRA